MTRLRAISFGLHSCANYMNEMGGEISARSDGRGKEAAFYLRFPLTPNQ